LKTRKARRLKLYNLLLMTKRKSFCFDNFFV
jgi:hypothetical protein